MPHTDTDTIPHGNERHGAARRGKATLTWKAWMSMRRRCMYPNQDSYPIYGGRGIKVCERWSAFEPFLEDMGECMPGMSLDRINVDGNYEPGNCRWATQAVQQLNRRNNRMLAFAGRTQPLAAWAHELGIKQKTLRARIVDHGMTVEEAFTKPVMTVAQAAELGREIRYGRIAPRDKSATGNTV